MTTAWENLTPNQSAIRAAHLKKFREAMTAELTRRGLSNRATYTEDMNALTGKPIRAIHVQELRDKLENIKTATYTDNPIQPNQTVVKAEHFEQVGIMINLLEAAPKVGGTSTCNAGCTGLCVNCSGTCTGGCTSCSGCSGCSGTCRGSCSGGCSGCTTGCSAFCTAACSSACGGTCFGNCADGCNTTCTGTCWSTCGGICTGSNYKN